MPSTTKALQTLPYPIIFIHGLNSHSGNAWNTLTDWMDNQYGTTYGGRLDFCLNYDANNSQANLSYYPTQGADIALFPYSLQAADYYYLNFDVATDGSTNSYWYNTGYVYSNQAAIKKQARALRSAIFRVLQASNKDKVILMCHSMGGLAAREYFQNSNFWQSDGLSHVAKIATLGTPHGGSNASFGLISNLFADIDNQSEAVRDLRETYTYSGDDGVYLYGGTEANSVMDDMLLLWFYNVDVDCNGTVGLNITGLNDKPLPSTIDYSCVIGTANILNGGDGIVDDDNANINTYYPNKTLNIFEVSSLHLSLTDEFKEIMQALDEPNEYNLSYDIDFNTLYNGFTTMQPTGGYPYDYDDYKVYLPLSGNVTVSISDIDHPNLMVRIIDLNEIQIGNIYNSNGSSTINFSQTLSAGSYYLEIFATPTTTSYLDTYKFYLNSTSTTDLGEYIISSKKILKVTDLLGRETKAILNAPFIEIYDDGTVEKRIIIE